MSPMGDMARRRHLWPIGGALIVALTILAPALALAHSGSGTPFVGPFNTVTSLGTTVPANGDVNPYGMALVRNSIGKLVKGDVLVSNFNDNNNLQGTGTTIVEMAPNGALTLFAQIDATKLPGACPGGVGLTTALAILQHGWVVVGSVPTVDGTSATINRGCLIVLNAKGKPVETFSGGNIDGPWDLTAAERGDDATLFVANVLSGTVLRIGLDVRENKTPAVTGQTLIGNGFSFRTDPNALVIGPTGVGLGRDDVLYVADSLNNRIAAIPHALTRDDSAGTGADVSVGGALNDPLGLAIAPNGDILTVNGNDGNLVETTPGGAQVATRTLDTNGGPNGAGTLFGLAVAPEGRGVYFVDDGFNTFNILH